MPLPGQTDGKQRYQASSTGADDGSPGPAAQDPVTQDPVAFASDVLGVQLWSKQCDVLRAVTAGRRVAVKSGNGLGKDFTAAVAILWYLGAHDPGIVLSTAPTFRQVRHVLWRQLHRLHRRAAGRLGGELLDTRWELADDRYALGLSASGADQFQGFHCENMLVVVDEAEGVSEPIYEAVEALMTSANPKLLLIGNPTVTYGAFHRAFHQESGIYRTITISALESPNVAAGRVVVPGLTTAEWVEERRAIWGDDSPLFRARVMGEFPDRSDDGLISSADIEAALLPPGARPAPERGSELFGAEPAVIGVDVARYGPDRSVIVVRRGNVVVDVQVYSGIDTMELVGYVVVAMREYAPERVNIDVVGLGSGVVDRLREQGLTRVRGVSGAESPVREAACANLRAEGYWTLRQRFAQRAIRIPNDPELIAELSSLRYTFSSRGKVLMESKEDLRRRGRRSPDKADALMLAFLNDTPAVELFL